MAMTPQEFAKTIKTKYPQYEKVEDNLLVKKVIEKYPTYAKQIDFTKSGGGGIPMSDIGETVKNIVPSGIKTAKGLVGMVKSVPDIIGQTIGNVVVDPKYAAKTALQDVSKVAELPVKGAINLVYNPVQSRKDVGKYVRENPTELAVMGVTGVPGAAAKIAGKVGTLLDSASVGLAKKALGYTKPFLKTTQARERANAVADTMLKEHVIPRLGNSKIAMENVESMLSETGQRLATIREELQGKGVAFNPVELDDKIIKELMPKLKGGAFDTTSRIVDRIRKTILAGGDTAIDFKTAGEIVDKLAENGKYGAGATASQTATAKLYRRAAGIVSDAIDDSVSSVAKATNQPKLLEDYMNNKALYGKAKEAQKVLNNRIAGLEGNNAIGLKNAIVGTGALATGNVGGAIAETGALELLKRRGAGVGAVALKDTAKTIRTIGKVGVPKGFLKYKGSK